MYKKRDSITTAYRGNVATQYDNKRFTTKQGLLFAKLELCELERVVSNLPSGSEILEVGCGTGRFSKYLGEQGYCVRAVDPSSEMIKIASKKCSDNNVTFGQEEGANLSSQDSIYDFVFSIRVTNQTESEGYALKMIREMIRVTKPDGLVMIEFVNKERPFQKKSKSAKLSFNEISQYARKNNCSVESQRGILIFSQTILTHIPEVLIPFWEVLEKSASFVLWRWASRGYICLRKH